VSDTYVKIRNEVLAGGGTTPAPEPAEQKTAYTGLAVIAGALVLLAIVNPWILLFVVGIVACIFLHEVGHYVTARRSGMKVTQFFLGFGPRLWSFHRNEVEYGLRAIPLGAFVRIVGMNNMDEVPAADEPRTYRAATYPRRMLVITAGSLMHFLIALVLATSVYATGGRLEEAGRVSVFGEVQAGSPADAAGLERGDTIVSFDGAPVDQRDELIRLIQASEVGDTVSIVIRRDGIEQTVDATLGRNPNVPDRAYLGIASDSLDFQRKDPLAAIGNSVRDLSSGAWQSAIGVVKVMNPVNLVGHLAGTNEDLATRPTTLIGVSRFSGVVGEENGITGVLLVLASVNVFVGIFNLLPLLPFDGGHAAIATYERIRSRRGRRYVADVGKAVPVTMVVLALVSFLFLTGLYLDIVKPI